jgi:hypothetical protein
VGQTPNPSETDPAIRKRLTDFLDGRPPSRGACGAGAVGGGIIEPLASDASARRYFRIAWDGATAVAAVYPEAFDSASHPFLDVARLMEAAELPVPAILEVDGGRGIIVQEDLGDCSLRMALEQAGRGRRRGLFTEAVGLIARIQDATGLAYRMDSIACRRALDVDRFLFEHRYFRRHFVESLGRGAFLWRTGAEEELAALASELAAQPRVLCHRDYHVDNLLVDSRGRLRFVDYQDACLGPAGYDLASLLYDRHCGAPLPSRLDESALVEHFLALRDFGMEKAEFARRLPLAAMQRGLLAAGVFSRQTVALGGRCPYLRFIRPTLELLARMSRAAQRFPALAATFEEWLADFPSLP